MPTAASPCIIAGSRRSSSLANAASRYSSASSTRIHSSLAWVLAKLRCGPKPSQSWATTRAPCALAIATVSSLLPLSTTPFSAANGTLSRQRAMLAASLWVMTSRVNGNVGMRHGTARSSAPACGVSRYQPPAAAIGVAEELRLLPVDARRQCAVLHQQPAQLWFLPLPRETASHLFVEGNLEAELGRFAIGHQEVLLAPRDEAEFGL